jgi:hypothetical protein
MSAFYHAVTLRRRLSIMALRAERTWREVRVHGAHLPQSRLRPWLDCCAFQLSLFCRAELDMVLALFSTGPVGIGDGLGHTNATRAKATCTVDGTLLQPDKPLTPLDWTIFPDGEQRIGFANCAVQGPHNQWPCRPQLLQTHTVVSGLQWHHIVAVAVDAYPLSLADLWPAPPPQQLGWHYAVVRRSVLEHGCVEGAPAFGTDGCATSTVCPGGDGNSNSTCLPVIDTKVGFWDVANLHIAWAQYLLAPCSPEGWCLLGEMGKYVKPCFNQILSESIKTELVDDGRPAPAANSRRLLRSAVAHSVAGRIRTAET